MRVQDKVVVVTGAAGGIGSATTRLLTAEGATVTCLDIDIDGGRKLVQDLMESGLDIRFIECDVTRSPDVERAIESVVELHGRIDVLCNVAGNIRGVFCDVVSTSESDWDTVQSVNLKSVYVVSRAVLPHMLRQQSGAIVNTSSSAGLIGYPNRAAYTAAKGGVVSLTRAMALDYADKGVRVNCVAPGVTRTPVIDSMVASRGEQELAELLRGIPMGRLADPEEIAAAIVFLASDDASYITGVTLPVDGGFVAK